jgi:toxin FitB
MFLLDTNVISEQTKPQPDPGVTDWLERHGVGESYLSVITLGEIEQGILLLGNSKRARAYRVWLEKLEHEFEITARAIQMGKKLAYADSLIAAIGVTHNLSIVTRNTDDFVSVTKNLVNPWRSD